MDKENVRAEVIGFITDVDRYDPEKEYHKIASGYLVSKKQGLRQLKKI